MLRSPREGKRNRSYRSRHEDDDIELEHLDQNNTYKMAQFVSNSSSRQVQDNEETKVS